MNIGDKVIHKTGGPKMVIVGYNDSMYATNWYDAKTGGYASGWFMKELLEAASDE